MSVATYLVSRWLTRSHSWLALVWMHTNKSVKRVVITCSLIYYTHFEFRIRRFPNSPQFPSYWTPPLVPTVTYLWLSSQPGRLYRHHLTWSILEITGWLHWYWYYWNPPAGCDLERGNCTEGTVPLYQQKYVCQSQNRMMTIMNDDDDFADEDILYETLESNLKINSYESIETEESIVGISISIWICHGGNGEQP